MRDVNYNWYNTRSNYAQMRTIKIYRLYSQSRVFALMMAVLLVGCDTTINPIVGEEKPFTVWGVLDVGADTQRVRVFPIEDYPGIDRGPVIDAAVSSVDLATGERREWKHRRVTYENGNIAHVFWSVFRPEPRHEYRIHVRRSDGQTSSASTIIPDVSGVDISIRTDSGYVPVVVTGDSINVIAAYMRYEATNVPPLDAPEGIPIYPAVFHAVDVSQAGKGDIVDDGGSWKLEIDMYEDTKAVFAEYAQNCLINSDNPNIALRRVELRFVIASVDWAPPNGEFDPDELVEPNRLSNVENGYGFIGAGEMYKHRWTPSSTVRHQLGYRYGDIARTPFSEDPPFPCFGGGHTSVWDIYF